MAHILKEFEVKIGLMVDQPKPVFRNFNNCYTFRRFFRNAEMSAASTKEVINLTKKLIAILQVV